MTRIPRFSSVMFLWHCKNLLVNDQYYRKKISKKLMSSVQLPRKHRLIMKGKKSILFSHAGITRKLGSRGWILAQNRIRHTACFPQGWSQLFRTYICGKVFEGKNDHRKYSHGLISNFAMSTNFWADFSTQTVCQIYSDPEQEI